MLSVDRSPPTPSGVNNKSVENVKKVSPSPEDLIEDEPPPDDVPSDDEPPPDDEPEGQSSPKNNEIFLDDDLDDEPPPDDDILPINEIDEPIDGKRSST